MESAPEILFGLRRTDPLACSDKTVKDPSLHSQASRFLNTGSELLNVDDRFPKTPVCSLFDSSLSWFDVVQISQEDELKGRGYFPETLHDLDSGQRTCNLAYDGDVVGITTSLGSQQCFWTGAGCIDLNLWTSKTLNHAQARTVFVIHHQDPQWFKHGGLHLVPENNLWAEQMTIQLTMEV